MALRVGAISADLCRVCTRDVTNIPSENIFNLSNSDGPSIHSKLIAVCSQVFADQSEEKPLATEALALPLNVCLNCKSKVDEAYELHQMCLESNRRFLEMLATPMELEIKEELEDTVELEPTQIQLPEVFAECLENLSKKPKRAVKKEPKESKVRKKAKKPSKSGGQGLEDVVQLEPPQASQILPERHEDQSIKTAEKKSNENQAKKKTRKPRNFRCEKCSATANRPFALFKHMRLKHPNEALPCHYRKCDEVFFDEAKLEEHKKFHLIDKPYPCPNCGKGFKTPYAIKVHSNQCTGHTPYLCTECGKAFSYSSSLHQHVLRHKEKSFACDMCPSKFHAKIALKQHMLTHTKERKFHCEICGSRFTMKHALMKHNMTHTDERPYPCELCDWRFRTSYHLSRHVRTHTGEKPFKCTHCDRAFAQTGDLIKHSKTHFGDNPYKCEQCDAAFRLMTDLRNHYKEHFQAGEKDKLDQSKAFRFTVVSTLNRRAEQEKNLDGHPVNQVPDEGSEVEMVQTILADLSEFPMETENKS